MTFKDIVDILSSIASLVAISTVLTAWYQEKKKPLKLIRVLVHKSKTSTKYHLFIMNRKAYPITIKRMMCLKKITYAVSQKNDYSPEWQQILNYKECLFEDKNINEIEAYANDVVTVVGNNSDIEFSKVYISVNTSHGYHLLETNNIDKINIGVSSDVYRVRFEDSYNNKLISKINYIYQLGLYYMQRVKKILNNK